MQDPIFGNWWGHFVLFTFVCLLVTFIALAMLVWFDRRYWARFHIRVGPNRAGPMGLLQLAADGIKMFKKEDIMPDGADKVLHVLAPILVFFPVFLGFLIIPFAGPRGGMVPDLNIGLLYVVGATSLCGIGLLTAGWASNNKYSLLGGMRAIATMVSYEFPVVLSLVGLALMAGSLSLNGVVTAQVDGAWFIFLQPLGFVIFFLGMMGEIARPPFDFIECDSEIIAGPNLEYSGFRFGVFMFTEWLEAMLLSCLVATLFLGGWTMPEPLGSLPVGLGFFLIKVFPIYLLLGAIKLTFPRFRIDQWMGFAWKGLLPLAVFNLAIIAVEVVAWGGVANMSLGQIWAVILINFAVAVLLIGLWSKATWRTGAGKVEVRVLRKGQIYGPEGYYGKLEEGR